MRLSIIGGMLLIWQGVPQNFDPNVTVTTIEGTQQDIAMGPVAALEIIKHLGTNGGGFFGANAAHPFENPSQIVNFMSALASLLIAAGLTYTFGVTVRDTRQGWTVWGAMWVIFAAFSDSRSAKSWSCEPSKPGRSPPTAFISARDAAVMWQI